MLSNSSDRLFGGVNGDIADIYTKMKTKLVESSTPVSVSDVDQKPKDGEEQLDEVGCTNIDKKLEETSIVQETQDYHTFMKREDFDNRVKELGLEAEKDGKDHLEIKDKAGDMKGWWNDHTGVGYIRKECCSPISEDIYEDKTGRDSLPAKRKFQVHYKDANGNLQKVWKEAHSPAGIYRSFLKDPLHNGPYAENGCKLIDIKHNGESVMPEAKNVVHGDLYLGEHHEETISEEYKALDQQDQTTHTESGDFTNDEMMRLAVQTAANRAKESGTHYHDEIIKELGDLGLDPGRHATHCDLDQAVCGMTNGKYTCHAEYGTDHANGCLKESIDPDSIADRKTGYGYIGDKKIVHLNPNDNAHWKAITQDDESRMDGPHSTWYSIDQGRTHRMVDTHDNYRTALVHLYAGEHHDIPFHESVDENLDESVNQELKNKIEHYVMKLKPKIREFKDKYGDEAESVMYGTATNLAKNDLGIKE
jgi:hypothetical protein